EEGSRGANISRRDQCGDGGIDGGGFLATGARRDFGRVHGGGSDRGPADLEALSDQLGVADSGRIGGGICVEIRDGRRVKPRRNCRQIDNAVVYSRRIGACSGWGFSDVRLSYGLSLEAPLKS